MIEYALEDLRYRGLVEAKRGRPIPRELQPALWRELETLCARLRIKGELITVRPVGESAFSFRTLEGRSSNGNGHGSGALVVKEPGQWVVIKDFVWIN